VIQWLTTGFIILFAESIATPGTDGQVAVTSSGSRCSRLTQRP
jgi:hypothetical protein